MLIKNKGDKTSFILELEGEIDEDAVFPEVGSSSSSITIDLDKVLQLNSCGIREWIKWMKSFPKTAPITLQNCPKVVIDQINTVDGFMPAGSTLESFKVPYFCNSCDSLTTMSYRTGEVVKGGSLQLPTTVPCSSCKKEAEMDVVPDRYFKFLKGSK